MEAELKEFGLNDNEIKVYKACLELGSISVTDISKRANIYRTLTYEVLDSLADKGLVSYVVKDKKKYFEAASPSKFIHILKEKERKIRSILPDLETIQNSVTEKPKITLFEGKAGVKTVMEKLLTETKHYDGLSPKKAMEELLQHYFPNFVERRKKAGIKIRLLIDDEPLTKILVDYKIIKHKYETGFFMYNNKVLIFNFEKKEPIAIVIENESYKHTMQMMFDMIWDSL
ncbi:MAG: helix-turn-helix domain-containing protein [archaeon]